MVMFIRRPTTHFKKRKHNFNDFTKNIIVQHDGGIIVLIFNQIEENTQKMEKEEKNNTKRGFCH